MAGANSPEPIAIVGSGCRLPGGSSSPSKLWELLKNPRDLLKKVDRFNADGFYNKDGHHHGATNVRHSYLLDEDFRLFDPGFFGIKPVEAESIDPLQRLVLETVYESLENAGLAMGDLQGSDTAFYVGIMAADYQDLLLRDIENLPTYFGTGTSRSIIANRVSYVFDWHGPSMTIDTACSSSMLALHQAVQTLRSGGSDVAVAAGGNLILGPEIYIAESKLNMLSSKGRSAMWDADVDGYGRGEGFVSVVLKRLSDAIRDGDSIDCIIRETGTNQDGRTKGITMPSAIAQTSLIRDTYAGCGLDLQNVRDRPQFFEAHGTGTKAGDPVEAEAIYNAFFEPGSTLTDQQPLYVGSIKTVVGHTEGTAGLAGILKTSLALQAGIIPPNMLFNSLNPGLTPFYGPLQIPTEAKEWPSLPPGVPRRASVNSFGFGGSNAHAILESYTPVEPSINGHGSSKPPVVTPFLFSAASEAALQRSLPALRDYLAAHPDTNLSDLAWTLRARRSTLPVKLALSASSVEELLNRIDEKLQSTEGESGALIGVRSMTGSARIFGVFTGQGAQWARMGQKLIDELPFAKDLATKMDAALQALPKTYQPAWSLVEELSRDTESSRVQEAAFSQPICTLVQVILVDLLRTAGITFSAVVGHSSGEIGAAYAAGFLSASDAVKIAYLRGFHASLAAGPSGQKGAMLAVGTSIEDAQELCDLPDFEGRLKLAASNSSSSVTLSGDSAAIAHAKIVFDDEKKFARLLKIDTAYHSHHMQPCAGPYLQSMNEVGIRVLSPDGSCAWYSSVHGGTRVKAHDSLAAEYWKDNMVNAVLFSQALTGAVKNGGVFNLALEIGPHPALKGPASQTIQELDVDIPYYGTLKRGQSDLESISDCLGSVWSFLGDSAVNFEAVQKLLPHQKPPRLLKALPTYGWDHDKPYWFESRKSRLFRSRDRPSHELLGVRCDEGSDNELRWRNFLSIQEVPWLEGHQVQSQTVFPAAGYVSMAIEAARVMVGDRGIQLLEVQDLNIGKAIVFHDEKTGVETMTTLSNVLMDAADMESKVSGIITADFTVSSHLSRDHNNLTKVASGKVKVIVGPPAQAPKLPSSSPTPPHLIDVDTERFYSALETCGYGYSGPFRALSSLQRRLNFCTGLVERPAGPSAESALLVHPALLDPAFQAVLGGYFWPGDGRLWSLFLPTSIRKVTVSPSLCQEDDVTREVQLPFNAWLVDSPVHEIQGDVAIYSQDRTDCSIQIEGLRMISFVQADPGADRPFFAETVWGVSAPDGDLAMGSERASDHEWELAVACERVAYFYWRELEKTLTPHERENCEGHHKQLLKTMTRSFEQVLAGKHPHVKKDWQHDDEKSITELVEKFSSSIDIRLQTSVGKALPAVVRGETTMLEHMLPDNMLDDFYTHGLGFSKYNSFLARMVRQLAHRYPKLNFIEIGAGTGGATSAVLDVLDSAYSSYTYTDISSGFFERAAARFAGEGDKLVFKMLDVEKPPASQGYQSNTYDVVIASNVLHATANLQNTLKNVRSLLKPGGYLFLLEITNTEPIRLGFTMGGLSGWWLGADDGRPYSPCISASNWNRVLRKSGFSGVDTVTPGKDQLPHPFSILASQAVDDRVEQLRRPLLKAAAQDEWSTLCVLGGQELETSNLVEEVIGLVGHRFDEVIAIESIDTDDIDLPLHATVVSFLDLDYHVLQNMSPLKLKSLQTVFSNAKNLLWVTQGAQNDNPYANATLGLLRSVAAEIPTLQCQLLDFDAGEKPHLHPQICADALLRLRLTGSWERDSASKTQLLWSTEPELLFRDGKLWVPRILPQNEKNDRLNGQRREIKHEAKPDSLIELSRKEGSWSLRERYEPLSLPSDAPDDSVVVKAKFSTLAAPKLHDGSFVFAIGQLDDTDQWVIATTIDRSSTLRVKRARVALLEEAPNDPAALLATVLAEALSDRIAALATKSELLIVLEPHALLASILLQKSEAGGFKVKFVTQDHTRSGSEWIRLSPWQSTRTIKEVLPKNISTFVDLTSPGQHGLSSLIVAALPPSSNIEHLSSIIQECPVGPVPFSGHGSEVTNQDLVQLVARASSRSSAADDSTKVRHISLAELPQLTQLCEPLTLIDWQVDDSLSLEVAQIRPEMVFKSDKTYLLVGLTGEIGRSLCQWMVHCGAGAVVLASRNPRIDQAWVDELECLGSIIKVLPLDATRRESIVELHAVLKRDLPPVAGIANGSMVLHDQFFVDMDTETLNKVLRPKVDASVYLDEVFNDTPLDFFIMFSSLASVVGNRGQSNYAAANTFMASLARQRRLRDQPGSVMSIGRMVGLGYLERVSDVVELQLIKYGFMPISEVDLHHLFAQAIMAGLPCSGEDPDIITALRPTREDEELQVPWYNNPRFSHMILPAEKKDVVTAGKKAVLSTRAQLEATTTIEDACKVLRDCFSSKLRVILQMAASSFRPEAALIELGVDSLVAVEIRSWFLKEVGVDMAVLKILGGASTVDLCQHAIDQASKDLLPNLGGVTQKEEKEPTKQIRKDMMNGDSVHPTTSNVTFFYEMRGRVRIPELSRAVKAVGKAHEGLRTCFFADEHSVESAWQGVMQTSKLELEYRKISNKDEITSEYARVRDTVYDLTQGKTMRIVVLSMDNETHAIIFGYHHIIMDGVGFQIFLRDLEHAYAGQAVRTPAMQYPSFAEKQRHAIEEGSLEKSLLFWRQELKDAQLLPVLSVAKVPSRQVLNKYQSCHVQHRLATSLIDKIKATCRGSAVTPSHFYLATFRVFLTRLAGVKNVCIGMADANRRDVESMSTVGLFLNLLPLLFEATGSTSFQAVMKETRNKVYEALGHSDVPLDEILNALRLPRSSSHSPLFQAFFDYRQGAKESLNFGDLELDVGDADLGEMAYDMVLDVTEGSKGSLVVLRGQDYLYGPKEMQRLLDSYLSLLENFANNPQISSDEARLFGEPQVKDALEAGRASAEDPAIILFTSGSTGTPKGLVLRHRSLASHLESYIKAYDVGREVFLQQSAFSFDLSLAQIFTALTTGGSLVVVPEDKRGDSTEIVNLICEECITWTFATPSEYASWLEFGKQQLQLNSSWSSALSGGERLTPKLVRLFNQLDHEKVRLYNTYGPAETIISATMSEVLYRGDSWNDDRPVPVGAPLPNYSIYILDEQLNALPQGFHGEVVIGGPSPVIGYLNNDELTHEHFLLDCFADSDSKAKGWTVMYRTGDMGRLGADGTLLFEGRRGGDTQVKLRGIRVDLADIQATLINTSDGIVSDAVVSVRTEEQIVVAHVVFAHDRRPEDATSYLKGLTAVLPLPSYMRPALTIPIDKIPLNIHGKKDLLAVAKLALPQLLSSHHTDTAMTTLQRRLAELWREILPKEFAGLLNIEEDTDFFEVGGNSLLLVRLQARLRDTFQVALPLKDLFDSSSLRDMAARVEKSQIHTTIDWDTETQLTPSVISAAGSHARQAIGRVGNQTVLLTGATGYLGSYILRRLLNDSSIGKVHCVAIRGQSQDNVSDRLPLSNNKVVVHEGDLTRSRIGLSEADARRLSEDVDIMIHCGARRSFWDSYYQLKAVNFDSTKELVSLAAPRRIPIHFLSSSGVLLLAGTPSPDSNLSVASFNPPTDGSEGYVASKWASEAYLEKAADQLGIPVTIHRFTPDTKAADLELGHQALEDLLNCCIKLDSLPDQASWEGRFDLIQSEGLANRIGTAALEDAAAGLQGKKSRTNFVHHQSEVSLRATDVFGFLEKEAGSRIRQRMPALEWVGEIKKIGFGYLFASHDVSLKSTGPDGTELVNRR
ncbi:hypothetical protein ACHAQH_006230 [Verticillium albo-atrum]